MEDINPTQGLSALNSSASFSVDATAGTARSGILSINGTDLETPNLFPVLNFYAGGRERSLFGGGIHRTLKEFMRGDSVIGGDDYSEYFDATMMSVASFTDYGLSKSRYREYLSTPIKEREVFESFDGMLFIDSGGFKFMDGTELQCDGVDISINQKTAFEMQRKLGADILVNLDYPIIPSDSYKMRVSKAQRTAENAAEFLRRSASYDGARYLTLHGYDYTMIDTFLNELTDVLGQQIVRTAFDGVALGSLVSKKDNKDALITAVSGCREVLADYGFRELPLHVLGISKSAIPLLVAVGVDTFDSSSHIHQAINRKYSVSLTSSVPLEDVEFDKCDCPVCTTPSLVARMEGEAEFQKDILGPVAMHNLIVQKRELADIRDRIRAGGPEPLREYIESTIARKKPLRKAAHRVVNESLGGYSL